VVMNLTMFSRSTTSGTRSFLAGVASDRRKRNFKIFLGDNDNHINFCCHVLFISTSKVGYYMINLWCGVLAMKPQKRFGIIAFLPGFQRSSWPIIAKIPMCQRWSQPQELQV
jgi:hypothetical protein